VIIFAMINLLVSLSCRWIDPRVQLETEWGDQSALAQQTVDSNGYKLRLFMKNRAALLGLLILAFIAILVLFGPSLSTYDAFSVDLSVQLQPPSTIHPLGTDNYGRDLVSRIFVGARYTLLAAVSSVAIGLILGALIGVISGYYGNWVDRIIMRVVDVLLAFPPLILAMAVVSGLGPSLVNAAVAIGISYIPIFARTARRRAIHIKGMDYVQSAIALGASNRRIILTDVFPNSMTPLIVQATVYVDYGILWVVSLSFIGLGATLPTPEWGLMIAEGRQYIMSGEWWVTVCPGLFIMLAVIGVVLIGDGLQAVTKPGGRPK
jgi:peptide/nickel transport system permease protein